MLGAAPPRLRGCAALELVDEERHAGVQGVLNEPVRLVTPVLAPRGAALAPIGLLPAEGRRQLGGQPLVVFLFKLRSARNLRALFEFARGGRNRLANRRLGLAAERPYELPGGEHEVVDGLLVFAVAQQETREVQTEVVPAARLRVALGY